MEIEAKIQRLDESGKGIFYYRGKEESCPGTLPGETVLIEKKQGQNRLLKVLSSSGYRIPVECRDFLRCGGCRFQHCTPEFEKCWKQDKIEKLFYPNAVNEILTMERPNYYRHKVIATFSGRNHRLTAGIYEEESHIVCPIQDCRLQNQKANQILKTILRLGNEAGYSAYDEDRKTGLLRHCLIRVSYAFDEVLVCLVTAERNFPGSRSFVQKLRKVHPEIKTVIQNINSRRTSVVLGNEEHILFGSGTISDRLGDMEFLIGSKTFYQVNPSQTERLYTAALTMANLKKDEMVLDAYCGIGTISLMAAKKCRQVIGVEINPYSIQNAIQNTKRNNIKNAYFIAEDCGKFMRQAAKDRVYFDCIIMDPAREGSDQYFLSGLIDLKPKRIVYISCNPVTQKRDVDFLKKGGYSIEKIQPVDMFPMTEHTENIVLLSHKSPDSIINVKVEFEDGEGKVPLEAIAERAKKYQPKLKITYKMIQEYVKKKYGFKVHTAYITE